MPFDLSFVAVLVLGLLPMLFAAWVAYSARRSLSEMCHMMNGMSFGMTGAFYVGALFGLAGGDFLQGSVAGTVVGLAAGVFMGRLGGPLGRMEGVMAAPMGGLMGGMTGVMMRFYDVRLFVPFLVAIVGFTMVEMVSMVLRNAEEQACKEHPHHEGHAAPLGGNEVFLAVALAAVAVAFAFLFGYSPGVAAAAVPSVAALPSASPTAVVQEITINVGAQGYTPNEVTVKRGVPVKLTLVASADAGCARSFVLPDFNVQQLVPAGGSAVVQFTPDKAGDFDFRCSMNMARGVLRVTD